MTDSGRAFLVARNPDADSRLPYLLLLPLGDGIVLKARESWPATARVYCHRFEQGWPAEAEIVEQTPVLLCRRRGAAIDLVLDRPRLARSEFVFTQVKGREAMQRLAELPLAAVVVEARYSALFKLEHVNGSWLADQLARLEVRYPEVHLVFADSRRFAGDWAYRFLTTALADASDPNPNG